MNSIGWVRKLGGAGLACLALFSSCGGDEVESPRRTFASDVEECAERMREIYRGMTALARERDWQPTETGSIPGDLVATGFWPAGDDARLACTGGGYAGRDVAVHPFERFPTNGSEVVMACANAGAPNHAGGETNVLYADGSVRTLTVEQEIEAGRLPEGTAIVPVGAGSPLADLAKLR